MAIAPVQTRFDGGEVSQRLSGRFDSELYKKALKQSKNFEPLAQGSLRMRSGSLFSNLLANADTRIRLIRIRVSNGQDYLAALLDRKMNLYAIDGGEQSLSGGGGTPAPVSQSELVANGNFAQPDGAGWQSRNFGGNTQGGVFFTDPSTIDPTTNLPKQLGSAEIANGADGTVAVLYQKIVLAAEAYSEISFKASIDLGKSFQIKISTQDPALWAGSASGGDVLLSGYASSDPDGTIEGPNGGDFSDPLLYTAVDMSQFANPNGVIGQLHMNPGTYYLSYQVDQANASRLWIDDVSILATYVNQGGGGIPASFDIPTPWGANEVASVMFDTETGRDRTIFCHPNYTPWQLTYGGPGNWSFGNVNFTGTPVSWMNKNFPAVVQVYGGRIYYGGEPSAKNRIVASKVNDPDNLTIGSNPGDALDFKIATKGALRWLVSSRTLLAGTDLGHYSISGSTGVPLVGDTQITEESNFQSAAIQAVKAGTHALFVTSDLRRVRAATFEFQTQAWEAKDLAFAAEHITKPLIKEIHHAWTPDSVGVVLLQDGTAAVFTFEPVEQVLAWWTINVNATICTAAVAQGPTGAYLWMGVQRNGAICLERLSLSEGDETLQYVDSYMNVKGIATVYADGTPGTIFEGLDHLAGLNVRLVLNGIVVDTAVAPKGRDDTGLVKLTDQQTGGESFAGQTATIGVAFKATAVTMPKPTKTGRAHSSKIGVILNESRIPKINGKRAPDRSPSSSADTVEPLFTGKKTIVNLGWSDGDEITIEQDLPFRTEVCAIYSITEATD
jgi:hypothetical protein